MKVIQIGETTLDKIINRPTTSSTTFNKRLKAEQVLKVFISTRSYTKKIGINFGHISHFWNNSLAAMSESHYENIYCIVYENNSYLRHLFGAHVVLWNKQARMYSPTKCDSSPSFSSQLLFTIKLKTYRVD